ncbi:MAG TPA: DUF4192 domain-containing protein [Micromonosporaceae bacterium]
MTSTAQPPTLSVRSPADLIAAVPYLLGFHPTDSVVAIALRGGQIIFTARGDLPVAGAPAEAHDLLAAQVAAVVGRQGAANTMVVGYGPTVRVTPAVDALLAALRRTGPPVLEALRVTDGRYWSYLCESADCCPPDGTVVDPESSPIAAAASYAGRVALPDRSALVDQVAAVEGPDRDSVRRATEEARRRLGRLLDDAPPGDLLGQRRLRSAGEAAVRDAIDHYRHGGRLTDDELAWLTLLLVQLPVRDYAWERITDEEWHVALWLDVARRAEPELVAGPAALLAFAAWRQGEGALACVAVERALGCAPDYSMARLMDEVLRHGLAPSTVADWPEPGRSRPGRRRPARPR